MVYLGNAFSLGMLDQPGEVNLSVRPCSPEQVPATAVSCVGHADTAALISAILGREVPMRRVSTSLQVGDVLYVAQYNGPRLPEGAKSLPEGANIRWMKVEVRPNSSICDCGCGDEASMNVATYRCAAMVCGYGVRVG